MSVSALTNINNVVQTALDNSRSPLKSVADSGDSELFSALLGSAIDNIKTTNNYISDAENEELKLALGETENTHDLTIALQKASTALQYTVAIRDRFLEAYKEIMNMQI